MAKKEEIYNLTTFGFLTSVLKFTTDKAKSIIDGFELYGRRLGHKNPAILLKGRDSEFVDIKLKKDK